MKRLVRGWRNSYKAGVDTRRASASLLALLLCGCGAEPRTITVEVIPGHETGAFAEDPAVAAWDIQVLDANGAALTSAATAVGGELDFGEIPADEALTFEVTGRDGGGATVVRGRSMRGIFLGAVASEVIPVFAERLGQWARPPGELPGMRVGATAAPLGERYLVLSGGEVGEGDDPRAAVAYDLLAWQGAAGVVLPRAARSVVGRGDTLLLIDDGGATWVDFAAGLVAEASLPAGLGSFAEVAGGRTVVGPDGRAFVVGATRAGAETDAVLVVEADGALRAARLSAPRAEAAAAWVEGAGVVVAAGSATAPGVEVLAADGASASARDFPADPTRGAGAVPGALGDVTLVGGVLPDGAPAPTRAVLPACAQDCVATEIDGAALPAAITGVVAYAVPGDRVIAVGAEPAQNGLTRSFVLSNEGVTEMPLREPRAGATAVPAPNGTLALLGGKLADGSPALTVEMWFPE